MTADLLTRIADHLDAFHDATSAELRTLARREAIRVAADAPMVTPLLVAVEVMRESRRYPAILSHAIRLEDAITAIEAEIARIVPPLDMSHEAMQATGTVCGSRSALDHDTTDKVAKPCLMTAERHGEKCKVRAACSKKG